jgi:hypothetical protein
VAQLRCSELGLNLAGDLLFFYDREHYGFYLKDRGGFTVHWGDCGSLCWMIPKAELARGDLSRAWMLMTCS